MISDPDADQQDYWEEWHAWRASSQGGIDRSTASGRRARMVSNISWQAGSINVPGSVAARASPEIVSRA